MGWPPTKRRPGTAAARAAIGAWTLVTSVSRPPAAASAGPSRSTRARFAAGLAARTTRSAPAMAAAASEKASATTPSSTARRGPSGVRLQAVTCHASGSRTARARAIEPPMRPRPRIARRTTPASLAGAPHPRIGFRARDGLRSGPTWGDRGESSQETSRGHAVQRRQANPIRVLLVDDHQLLTDALAQLLSHEPDLAVVGVAGSVAEARTAARERVDVVLMDYRLPDGTVLDAIQAGADGYLTKDHASQDVVDAVRAAHAGEILLPRAVLFSIARRVATAPDHAGAQPPTQPLTPRELEILRALT